MSRSRTPALLALVAALALLAGACKQPSNTPSAYGDITESNFVHGCTGEGSGTNLASNDACQCAYDWLVANVPYNATNASTPTTITTSTGDISQNFMDLPSGVTFSSINNDVKTNPDAVPQEIQTGLARACASKGWKAPTTSGTSGGGPTTSTPG